MESSPTVTLTVVCPKPEFNVILFCFFILSWFPLEVKPFSDQLVDQEKISLLQFK